MIAAIVKVLISVSSGNKTCARTLAPELRQHQNGPLRASKGAKGDGKRPSETANDEPNRARVSGAGLARDASPPSWRSSPFRRTDAISLPFASKYPCSQGRA